MAETPVQVVQAYLDAFNRQDEEGMVACFAVPGVILDGMAPHLWSGPSAARDWWRDVLVEGEHLGAGDYHATVGDPLHNDVTGDDAYLVFPAAMTFNFKGQPVKQGGARFTFALRREDGAWRIANVKREDGAWRIAAWAWAKGQREA